MQTRLDIIIYLHASTYTPRRHFHIYIYLHLCTYMAFMDVYVYIFTCTLLSTRLGGIPPPPDPLLLPWGSLPPLRGGWGEPPALEVLEGRRGLKIGVDGAAAAPRCPALGWSWALPPEKLFGSAAVSHGGEACFPGKVSWGIIHPWGGWTWARWWQRGLPCRRKVTGGGFLHSLSQFWVSRLWIFCRISNPVRIQALLRLSPGVALTEGSGDGSSVNWYPMRCQLQDACGTCLLLTSFSSRAMELGGPLPEMPARVVPPALWRLSGGFSIPSAPHFLPFLLLKCGCEGGRVRRPLHVVY